MCIYKYGSMVSKENLLFYSVKVFYIHWGYFCIYLSAPSKWRSLTSLQGSYCPGLGPVCFCGCDSSFQHDQSNDRWQSEISCAQETLISSTLLAAEVTLGLRVTTLSDGQKYSEHYL